ncbi:MAG: uracil-DNA glycosylase family protein [Spiribacter sp.]|nr:uracil-DNA glycosylase family protein [Spiribacter sp.]
MRDLPAGLQARFEAAAHQLPGLDHAVYEQAQRDPRSPIFGLGAHDAAIAFFGRDPGRDEVHAGVPFIGAGGRQVRRVLHQRQHGDELTDRAAAIAAGEPYFWANTVPYKPLGNKAWSMAIKRQFQPLVATVLHHCWSGSQVITLGREAFFWFGIGQTPDMRARLEAHWADPQRFETSLAISHAGPDGVARTLALHPLPHPSPLNATWFKRFPGLLAARLETLEGLPWA